MEVIPPLHSNHTVYTDVIRDGHAGAGALHHLFGNEARIGFIPIQRKILSEDDMKVGNSENVFSVDLDSLRKSEQGPKDTVVMYDCNATGSTLESALQLLQNNYSTLGKGLDTFVYVTIGSRTVEFILCQNTNFRAKRNVLSMLPMGV